MIVDDDLIAKFLSGEASPEEAMALDDWLNVPDNKARFDEMSTTWNMAKSSKSFRAAKKEEAWRRIRPAKKLGWPIGIAASVLLVLSIWMYYTSPEAPIISVSASEKIDTVRLPDESVVTLNKNSAIKYPAVFKGNTREIDLEGGEAFFSIKKNKSKPFIVHAGFSNITVLGTEFNVEVGNDTIEVGVNEGVVLVVTPSDSVYVRKGFTVAFLKSEKAAEKENDPNKWAYATRKLVFKDTPMKDVIKAVEKTYSCKISVSSDDIKKCTLNTTFDEDSAEKILLLISETLNLKLEHNGQVYSLEGDGCR